MVNSKLQKVSNKNCISGKMNQLTQRGKTQRYTLYFAQRDIFSWMKIPCISSSRPSLQYAPTHRLNFKSSEMKAINFIIHFFLNLPLNLTRWRPELTPLEFLLRKNFSWHKPIYSYQFRQRPCNPLSTSFSVLRI